MKTFLRKTSLFLLMFLQTLWVFPQSSWTAGSGSESDPYLIENISHLQYLAQKVSYDSITYENTYFKLTADLDLSSVCGIIGSDTINWTPIGRYVSSTILFPFKGIFKGNGKTISNLYINTSESRVGLFGLMEGCIVDSLNLENVSIVAESRAGGLCGLARNSTQVSYCSVSGSVTTTIVGSSYAGGLCGMFNVGATMTYCTNNAEVTGDVHVGGLAGILNTDATIEHSTNNGLVFGISNYAGGISGYITTSSAISDCYNSGMVRGNNFVGGICGRAASNCSIARCTNNGSASCTNTNAGGICGYASSSVITECVNNQQINGYRYVGGISGYLSASSVIESNNNQRVTGDQYAGGVSGFTTNLTNILDCKNISGVTANQCVGGISGYTQTTCEINHCSNSGIVTANITSDESYAGGITGVLSGSLVFNCNNSADVIGFASQVGGIAGGGHLESQIENCFNSGSLTQSEHNLAGGISGVLNSGSFISYCINIGNINGDNSVGAICGRIADSVSVINQCYYDKQLCRVDGINDSVVEGAAEGRMTIDLIGNNPSALTEFPDSVWVFTEGMYPRPIGVENDESTIAASAFIYFASCDQVVYETIDSVATDFRVSTQNGVSWISHAPDVLSIDGENVSILYTGEDTTVSISATINNVIYKTVELRVKPVEEYFVNIEGNNTICIGDTIILSVVDDYNTGLYTWYTGNDTSSAPIGSDSVIILSPTTSTSYTLKAQRNCEIDLKTVSITVYPTAQIEFEHIACDSYIWNDETYHQSGDYSQQFQSIHGCDSVVTLHLTVNESKTHQFSETVCDSYTWNGVTYTQSGDCVQTLSTVNFCDSIVTLHLTVNHSANTEFSETACDDYVWNNEIYTQSGDYVQEFQTAAGCDSTVTLHLSINNSSQNEISQTACDEYVWNNEIYTQSGDYVQELQTAAGCDSTVTLHLSINNSAQAEISQTACDEYVWNNEIYTQSGDYVQVLQTAAGCDSTVTLHLSINNSAQTEISQTACDEYVWNNEIYTQSGNYVQEFQTATGCDSTVTLHLTINNSVQNEFSQSACDEYIWNNEIYTQSGTYVQEFQTGSGCDSVITLHLTINNSVQTEISQSACDEYVWNNEIYTQSGTYAQQFQTTIGCDSIVTLHLTINNSVQAEISQTACDEYVWNNEIYTQSGDYLQQFQTIVGCDSIVTLHLTIHPSTQTELIANICFGEDYTENGFEIVQPAVGTYTETRSLTSINGCDSIVLLALTVNELPMIEISGESEINAGESTTLTATGAETYLWSTGETTPTITVSPSETTDYSVIGIDDNGCESTAEVTVTVHLGIAAVVVADYQLYPNPAKDYVMVAGEKITKIEIFNGVGQLTTTETVSDKLTTEVRLDTKSMEEGFYLIRIHLNNNSIITKRLVVVK
ncbi:MAG: T9SS type A sorting domain-containing protein [Bacteroidales bacterium]|nr:T9SS type A sorting domain-containing protein [Bacteroidales bacterium]